VRGNCIELVIPSASRVISLRKLKGFIAGSLGPSRIGVVAWDDRERGRRMELGQGHGNRLMRLPAAADEADRDGGEQERDDFGDAAQSLFAHPTAETVGIAKCDGDKGEVHHQGQIGRAHV